MVMCHPTSSDPTSYLAAGELVEGPGCCLTRCSWCRRGRSRPWLHLLLLLAALALAAVPAAVVRQVEAVMFLLLLLPG